MVQPDRSVEKVAGRIARLEKQFAGLSMSARLVHTSLEDGTVPEYDADGNLVSRWGKQPDGTHGVVEYGGPIPPTPSRPIAEGDWGSYVVTWDGTFAEGAPAPLNLRLIEVYDAAQDFQHIEQANLVGTLGGPDGDRTTVSSTPGVRHVALVAVSRSGRRSAVSDRVMTEVQSFDDFTAIDEEARQRNEEIAQDLAEQATNLATAQGLLGQIGAADGPQGVAQAVQDYLAITLGDLEPGELAPEVVTDFWDTVVVARMLVATERIITENVMATGSVTGRAMNVVEELPDGARFSIQPDGIRLWQAGNVGSNPNVVLTLDQGLRFYSDAGETLAWLDPVEGLVLAAPGGGGARNSGRGLQVFGPDDALVIQLGAFEENILAFYRDGNVQTSVSESGVVGPHGAFETLSIGGVDFSEIQGEGPRGVIYDRNFPISRRMTTLGGHSYIIFDVEQGRRYEVNCRVTGRNLDSKGVQFSFYHTSANLGQPLPGPPSVAGGNDSTQTAQGRKWILPGSGVSPHYASMDISFTYTSPGTVDKTVALLVGAEPFEPIGAGQLEVASAWWTVKDIGTASKGSAGSYSESGGGSSGGGSSPAPETPKRRYTRKFNSTSWRAFQNVTGNGSGSRTTSVSGPTQGRTPYYPSAGEYASHYYFNTDEIQSFAGGGAVVSARVRFRLKHSHANSGGTARIHLHGHSPRDDWGTPVAYLGDKFLAPGERPWVGALSQGWATGAVRGIGLWSRGSISSGYYTRYDTVAELELIVER